MGKSQGNGEPISEMSMIKQVLERLETLSQLEKTIVNVTPAEGGGSTSCQIERTAKGEKKITLKVYSTDLEKVDQVCTTALTNFNNIETELNLKQEEEGSDAPTENNN